jgi:hypothetical protein
MKELNYDLLKRSVMKEAGKEFAAEYQNRTGVECKPDDMPVFESLVVCLLNATERLMKGMIGGEQ